MSDEDDLVLNVGGESVTLAQIAGVNMDDVEEVRRFLFPTMVARWEVDKAELGVIRQSGKNVVAVKFQFKCKEPIAFGKPEDESKADSLIGKLTGEPIKFIDIEAADTFGRIKAFMADCGFKGSGSLTELLNGFVGTEFIGKVALTPDPNDTDKHYNNMYLQFGDWRVAPIGSDKIIKAA